MESLPRYRDYSRWEEVSVAISFLDFVTVAGVELLPALGSVTEELRGGPAVTQSLFTLHNFVVSECSNKSMLYDGRRTVLTRVLREALVGDSHSIFLCTCSLANTTHTLDTVRFGDAAAWLVQHPTRRLYLASLLHTTTAAILHSHQAARRLLCSKRTHGTAGSGLRKEQQEEQEEQDSRVRQEVRKMLGLARTIFPINTSINTKRNELESEEEPVVARKRGRPRKYPVRFKPFGRECPTKIDYLALWKSRYLNSEDPRHERGRKQKREREEKFYMAGAFTLTTTSKRHGLRHLYKTGSLRTSDTSTYYGGYLKEGLKKKEEEERGVREEDEKENEEMEEEKEEEEDEECKFGKECVWVREEDEEDEKKNEGIGEEKVKEGECKSVWVREQEDEKENERIREEKEEEEECETDKRKERVRREKDEKKCRVEKKNERIREEKEEEEKCQVNKRDGEKREEKKEEEGREG
ncbi:golgin subfamily A member 6-like protein 22 isoform X2 [Scylla paramamosain]|uniref:golgin subfamily A member 6-like protein 22 isoform X2 n=1 Tax=Scylla paramamosain TaxID=85552 RepID=UPI003082BB74